MKKGILKQKICVLKLELTSTLRVISLSAEEAQE